jgi:hypothetical protein
MRGTDGVAVIAVEAAQTRIESVSRFGRSDIQACRVSCLLPAYGTCRKARHELTVQ